ncbi:hypothetical protein GSI_00249 [Ganoderma sinense ZZ0214-1]|uniref:Uncharacterized protein n=1 Tax=Ganoderma sinense ZZ0214-1 TaxID=1077348 RepID=A0A2G8SS24_9APHY|nr:hypothetical protein GSI_00249 [Ganoderma sinense ZZ0214-1]
MLPRQLVQELDIGLLYSEAPTSDEVEEILAGAQSQALVQVVRHHRPDIILLEWSLDSPLERHSDCRMVTLKIKASCLIDAILLPPDPLEMRILEWDQEEECLEALLLEEEMEEVEEEEEAVEVEEILEEAFREEYLDDMVVGYHLREARGRYDHLISSQETVTSPKPSLTHYGSSSLETL